MAVPWVATAVGSSLMRTRTTPMGRAGASGGGTDMRDLRWMRRIAGRTKGAGGECAKAPRARYAEAATTSAAIRTAMARASSTGRPAARRAAVRIRSV
ncbi:hypothetical protein GCM10009576_063140 [Streptomyces rhizosphaericus]|uniref:Secreted protein n=1 Tax=Streptomyces rhizosphaericus TaxID=114699 RepID=A0ABN1SH38_9ACTN